MSEPIDIRETPDEAEMRRLLEEKAGPEMASQMLVSDKLSGEELRSIVGTSETGEPLSRKARRAAQAGEKGRGKTASLDRMYGKLVDEGLVRIVRKKGKPPQVVWL
uniref:Transcriptional regulator n=1 Tax=Caulobacter phage BL57 TaxID=3348355 RepID=A0AB74UID7_9VIRU